MSLRHTACGRGKRVLVILKDGTRIIDKFLDRTSGYVILAENGRIAKEKMRSFTILKSSAIDKHKAFQGE